MSKPRLTNPNSDSDWTKIQGSWELFKKRVRTFPKGVLFDNLDKDKRKKQYYELGVRYLRALSKHIETGQQENTLKSINILPDEDSFLETCRTGWNQRIAQLELLSGAQTNSATPSTWDLLKETRRGLLEKFMQSNMTSLPAYYQNQSVHILEIVNASLNSILNLGYSQMAMA